MESADKLDWIRIQAEEAQNSIINVQSGMTIAPPIYSGGRRCTYSDVVTIVTTSRPMKEGVENFSRMNVQDMIQSAPFRVAREVKVSERWRRHDALVEENKLFMSRLNIDRQNRWDMENTAANKIQRVYRGYHLRRDFMKLKKKMQLRKKVRSGMQQVTRGTTIILEENAKQRMRKAHQHHAAMNIQKKYRMILGQRVLEKERRMRGEEKIYEVATKIQGAWRTQLVAPMIRKLRRRWFEEKVALGATSLQRIFRGHIGRKKGLARKDGIRKIAVYMLQGAYRVWLAQRNMQQEKKRVYMEKRHQVIVRIQSNYRGLKGRQYTLKLREMETHAITEAAALCIQRIIRGTMGRRMASVRLACKMMNAKTKGAIQMQRAARGYLGRALFAKEQDETCHCIFTQTRLGKCDLVDDIFSGYVNDDPHLPTDTDSKGNTVFIIACKYGHQKLVRKSLQWGMDLNHVNNKNHTGIYYAVCEGYAEVAQYLLTKNPTLNVSGRTLLHEAAKRGMLSTVQALLLHGINVNEADVDKRCPIHEAIQYNTISVLKVLLQNKANVNVVTVLGDTPLHMAANHGNTNMVTLLLDYRADASLLDINKKTPWRLAVAHGHEECAKILRQRYCEQIGEVMPDMSNLEASYEDCTRILKAAENGNKEVVEEAFEQGLGPTCISSNDGNTILMAATLGGHMEIIKMCVTWGLSINDTNFMGQTALYFAPNNEVASYLIELGADMLHSDNKERTPLHHSAIRGFTFSDKISTRGILVDAVDINHRTPLHFAADRGYENLCHQLLNLGANPELFDDKGLSALHLACQQEAFLPCVRKLLNHGMKPDLHDTYGRTPAHEAAANDNLLCLKYLQSKGAELKLTDAQGRTAIFDAVSCDSIRCVHQLVESGVSLHEVDIYGNSLLHIAMASQSEECLLKLLSVNLDAALVREPDKNSCLHVAAEEGFTCGIVELFKHSKQNLKLIHEANASGDTPTRIAIRFGHENLVACFHDKGANLKELHGTSQQSLLHCAASATNPSAKVIDKLVKLGTPLTTTDKKGDQPIHVASSVDDWSSDMDQVLLALLNNGAPVNACSKLSGMTPLHCASKQGNTEACRLLLENGANITATFAATSTVTLTALQIASQYGKVETADFLREAA